MAKFQKGQSGNPAGRGKGTKDKRTALRSLFEQHKEELIRVVVDKAKAGDSTALRICIDRLIAPVRGNTVRVDGFNTGTLAERGEAVQAAIAAGEITVEDGSTLMSVLGSQAKIVEATELERRIAALEKQITEGNANGKT